MLNYKNEIKDVFYFSEEAKNYFLQDIELAKETKEDFDVNYSFYKLKDNSLIINDKVVYKFKTKKQFLEVCKKINLLHALEELKQYSNITIFSNFKKYDINGNGIYNVNIFANYEKQKRILNITSLIAIIRACKGISAIMSHGSLVGDDMTRIYIRNMLQQYNIDCFI